MNRRTWTTLLVVVVALFALLALNELQAMRSQAAQPALELDVPFFSQTALRSETVRGEPAYTLGDSDLFLWEYGCGVASLAMVYRHYGADTDLARLNESLRTAKGFVGGLLAWDRGDAFLQAGAPWVKGIERINTARPQDHRQRIDDALANGEPVIAYLNGEHYVVITGRSDDEYLINDPWAETADAGKDIALGDNLLGKGGFDQIRQLIFVSRQEYAPTNGVLVKGHIRDKYITSRGALGPLGNPLQPEDALSVTQGVWQRFEHGAIFAPQSGNSLILYGPLWEKFEAEGGLAEFGLPRSDPYSYFTGPAVEWRVDLADASLLWTEGNRPERARVVDAENGIKAEYFANPNLTGAPVYTRYEPDLLFDWGEGGPGPWVGVDDFSARYTQTFWVGGVGWRYNFVVSADDGVWVTIDGETVVDAWDDNIGTKKFGRNLGRGNHTLVIEYRERNGAANLLYSRSAWPATPVFAAEATVASFEQLPASAAEYVAAPPIAQATAQPTPTASPTRSPSSIFNITNMVDLADHEVMRLGRGIALAADYSPDGRTLAVASTLGVWLYALNPVDDGRLLSHPFPVMNVTWSPDGQTVVSESMDQSMRLWRVKDGVLLHAAGGFTEPVMSVAWSPDSRILASVSGDGSVRLWRVEDGFLLHTLEGHTNGVSSVAWSPDSQILASGAGDGVVRVWRADDGLLLHTLESHTDRVESVAWSPDGATLASGSWDGTVRLWRAEEGLLLHTLEGHTGVVRSVAWSPDGVTLASGSLDGTVRLWRAEDGLLLHTLEGHTSGVMSVEWSPDGQTLASASMDATARLWRAADGILLYTLESGDTDMRTNVSWTPDSQSLAIPSLGGSINLWRAADGVLLHTLEGHTAFRDMAWSPDGQTLASGSWDGTVRLWQAVDGALLHALEGHTNHVISVVWSPDGQTLASTSLDASVRLWRAVDGVLLHTLEQDRGMVKRVAWSPDGQMLASVSVGGGTMRLWRVEDGTLLRTLGVFMTFVEWSPNGQTLASEAGRDTIGLWRAEDGVLLHTLEGVGSVSSLAWSPDGQILAVGADEGIVRLWRAEDGVLLHILEGHRGFVRRLAWSPDGQTLASGADDARVCLWRIADGALVHTLEGHITRISSLAWSPNGQTLASGAEDIDPSVRLWRAENGVLLHMLEGPLGVQSLAWSPDGQTLASLDGTVRLWRVESQ